MVYVEVLTFSALQSPGDVTEWYGLVSLFDLSKAGERDRNNPSRRLSSQWLLISGMDTLNRCQWPVLALIVRVSD